MKYFLAIILTAIIVLPACKKEQEGNDTSPPSVNNLVCNPSFEINGQASIDCWTVVKNFNTYPDTFSTDVPTNGGQFSLRLEGTSDTDWDPYAESYVTDISGNKIVSLSAYIKALLGGQPIYLWLEHIRGGQVIESKSDHHWAFKGWKEFSVTDTLLLQPQDSLRIKIIQTTGQNSSANIDMVKLTTN